jgi:adenosine kinase
MSAPSYQVFCIGNPLLDMQVVNGENLLKKYDLKANDAILAGEKHLHLYEEIVKEHKVTYVAGGAVQNSARGAAVRFSAGFLLTCSESLA